jgi:hypothetical protein
MMWKNKIEAILHVNVMAWHIYIGYSIKLQKNVISVKQNAKMWLGDGANTNKQLNGARDVLH